MFENFQVPSDLLPSDPRFGCGPSLVPVEFVDQLRATGVNLLGTSHRKPAVKNLMGEVQKGLSEYFNIPDDYMITIGNGGATYLFDAIGLCLVDKKIAHYTCGEFSSKWYKSSKNIPWIDSEEHAVEFGRGITPANASGADVIACTLNETSTGVQLDTIPDVDENTLLAVDATSGAGQCPIEVSKTDVFFFSPQKVFASEGGTFVMILSPKAQARAKAIMERSDRYIPEIMSFKYLMDNAVKNQTYNTPSISTLFFLNCQLKLMNQMGYAEVKNLAKKKADLLYSWAESKDYLSPFINEEQYRSWAVATIDIDEKYPIDGLVKRLEQDGVANGIGAYRKLGRNQLRISLFHNVKYEDLEKLTKIVSMAIENA